MERVPALSKVTLDDGMFARGWTLFVRFSGSDYGRQRLVGLPLMALRSLWVIVLATGIEQIRRNDLSFHPYMDWGEMRTKLGPKLDTMFTLFVDWKILKKIHPLTVVPQILSQSRSDQRKISGTT